MKSTAWVVWIPILGLVGLIAACVASDARRAEAGRLGRRPAQVSYRGSSPYFKVDFDRFTGEASCVWCHPDASAIWREKEAFHRSAYSLLDDDARRRPECVKCHVTAFNQDGFYPLELGEKQRTRKLGFTFAGDPEVNAHFEGVQCEACHGPNCGNRYSKKQLVQTCLRCHNEECPEFTGFSASEAWGRLAHTEVGAIEEVDYESFVGLESCFMCHRPNYEAWRRDQGPHVEAFTVLSPAAREDPACLKCHTTGFNRDGVHPHEAAGGEEIHRAGYTFGGDPAANAKFEGVQCEACHGINCGTFTVEEEIAPRCLSCHSGECANDDGGLTPADFAAVRHRPPADYAAAGPTKVTLEWYDLEKGKEVARAWRLPLLVMLSNPPDG